jgi:hypothetical protein
MSPETKFHSLVLGLTVGIMFVVISILVPHIQRATVLPVLLGTITTIVLSAGTYGLIAKGLVEVLRRFRWLKAKLLGPYYLEGTWVGYFRGHQKDIRYIVQVFEQDLSSLTITGKSYTEGDELHAQWFSEATSLNIEKGQLIYTSSLDVLSRKRPEKNLVVVQLERKSAKSAPYAIEGYAADLSDGVRIKIREEKASSRAMAHRDALPQAKETFAKSVSDNGKEPTSKKPTS